MSVKIGHACIDENRAIHGGTAGDQTGKEVCTRTWYAGGWTVLLRPKDPVVAEKMAKACEAGCANNKIGYDQYQRNTLRTRARAADWDLGRITAACECDCSSFMSVCAEAAGVNMDNAYTSGNAPATSNMRSKFKATGAFEVLTEGKYLIGSRYLRRGDILVKEGSHTVMVLSNGSAATSSTPAESSDQKPVYAVGENYTLQTELKVRTGPGTNHSAKTHNQLTSGGQSHDTDNDGALDKGTVITCKEVRQVNEDIWIRCPSGWLAAYYCGNVYIK